MLTDRGLVAVRGEDARKLIAGLVTNDVDLLDARPAIYAGLLSPQGKVLFDFVLVRVGEGYLLDVARDQAEALAKRLMLYKLRAKVSISDESAMFAIAAMWGAGSLGEMPDGAHLYRDPRHPELGARVIAHQAATSALQSTSAERVDAAAYHAHRIALGVPEGGKDYDFGDAFPHEANFDLVHGVSFEKGCYVGQEIVARMEHRGTVRKRVVRVRAGAALSDARLEVKLGDVVIGRLGSVCGGEGLALVRLDRVIEGLDKGIEISSGGVVLEFDAAMIAMQRSVMAKKASAS